MAMTGVGNLTPQQAAERAERWFGARVDYRTQGRIKIYPKDPEQPVITISARWAQGSDRLNDIKRLQRHGLDVINGQTPPNSKIRSDGRSIDPHLTQKIEIPTEKDEPVTLNTNHEQASRNGTPTPALIPPKTVPHGDYQALLGMLAEAETRDKEQRTEIANLRETVDQLMLRVTRLDEIEHQNRGRYAALSKRIKVAEERVERLGTAPMTEAERAEQERIELMDKAIALLESLPPAATMAAGSIAASLGLPEKGNLIGKLMATAAADKRVTLLKVGSQKLYRALPKEG